MDIALHYLVSTRYEKKRKYFYVGTSLSGAEEREREREEPRVGTMWWHLTYLHTCPYMYVVPLTAGNRFLYGDARSC